MAYMANRWRYPPGMILFAITIWSSPFVCFSSFSSSDLVAGEPPLWPHQKQLSHSVLSRKQILSIMRLRHPFPYKIKMTRKITYLLRFWTTFNVNRSPNKLSKFLSLQKVEKKIITSLFHVGLSWYQIHTITWER